MRTITYVSTADPSLSVETIHVLLQSAEKNNLKNQINGIFIFSEGNFFQILEGEESIIQYLFEKIKKDPRHYDIIKLLDKETSVHSFNNYKSSFTVIQDGTEVNKLYKFLKTEKQNNPDSFNSVSYLTQKFMSLI